MVKGNESAIDLGLEICCRLGKPMSQVEIAAYCDAARQILGLKTKPFRQNDLWHIERRALHKLKAAADAKSLLEWAEKIAK